MKKVSNFKKVVFGGLFLGLISIGIIGCKKEIIQDNEMIQKSEVIKKFEMNNIKNDNYSFNDYAELLDKNINDIGLIHNELLENVYENLSFYQTEIQQGKMTIDECIDMSQEKSIDFFTSKIGENSRDLITEFIKGIPASIDDQDINIPSSIAFYINNIIPHDSVFLSSSYLSDIKSIKEKAKADSKLTQDDLRIVLITCSVAESSFSYWHKNSNAWYSVFHMEKVSPGYQGRVLRADVKGAISGVINGARWMGWQGAVVGGLVGGSVRSAYRGVYEYFN